MKRIKIIILFLAGLAVIYLLIEATFLKSGHLLSTLHNIAPFLKDVFNFYIHTSSQLANIILNIANSPASVYQNIIFIDNQPAMEFDNGVLLRKWFAACFLLIWLTPVVWKKKLVFTLILLLAHFIIIPFDIAILSHAKIYYEDNGSAISISRTPGVLMIVTVMFIWVQKNKQVFLNLFSRLKLSKSFMEERITPIFIVIYLFVILNNFILGFFAFNHWIAFLFHSSKALLGLLNYEAIVNGNILEGSAGSILMDKNCLGFSTMLLFSSVVFLTGEKGKARWGYIVFGLVILNLANIFRFVFLFIHLQKHGDYKLSMEVHDMYNYIIYILVLIMWIFWFEKSFSRNRAV